MTRIFSVLLWLQNIVLVLEPKTGRMKSKMLWHGLNHIGLSGPRLSFIHLSHLPLSISELILALIVQDHRNHNTAPMKWTERRKALMSKLAFKNTHNLLLEANKLLIKFQKREGSSSLLLCSTPMSWYLHTLHDVKNYNFLLPRQFSRYPLSSLSSKVLP